MKAITIDSNWRNDAINHRFIETNGIKMHIAEQGRGELLILCHGFPECWYAWRHQISAIAEAGFHVVAPDLRGYGQTDQPQSVEAYNILELTSDIVGLVHALDREQAAIVGHDQGAPLAWHCGLLRPDLFKAIALLSVPYRPRTWDSSPFCETYSNLLIADLMFSNCFCQGSRLLLVRRRNFRPNWSYKCQIDAPS